MESKRRFLLRGIVSFIALLLLEYIYRPYIYQQYACDYHIYELLYGFLFIFSARFFYLSVFTKKQTLIRLISFIVVGLLFGVAYGDLFIFLGVSVACIALLLASFFTKKKDVG